MKRIFLLLLLSLSLISFATPSLAESSGGESSEKTFLSTVNSAFASVLFFDVTGGAIQMPEVDRENNPVMDPATGKVKMKTIGFPFLVAILAFGALFFTFYYGLINIFGFRHALDVVRGKYDKEEDEGEISHFRALTSALSATVGLGNIAGVAVAIQLGGPGAVLWMIILAAFGMSMKFGSCTLAQMYRKVNSARKRSDELLLNILPAETAEELKEKGFTSAKSHDDVAIMFTDFEGFSKGAQNLNPHDLVRSIDCYFKKFDEISAEFKLEKIKTIGDSYLAASGLIEREDAAIQIVEAAIRMQDFVSDMLANPSEEITQPFPMRIGIHVGPVVAGVVGVKKFQYDIWGNTVNIASRIESSGQSGKVAISEVLYQKIKTAPGYTFEKREQIDVKNIGLIQTYFVYAN